MYTNFSIVLSKNDEMQDLWFSAMKIQAMVFWVVIPCSDVGFLLKMEVA
jgi:hypothetical protein